MGKVTLIFISLNKHICLVVKLVEVLGKEFIPRVLVMKRRKVRAKGKEYYQYYINVPKDLAKKLEESAGIENPDEGIPILALLRVAEWYHLLDWENVTGYLKRNLPDNIRKELEELGFIPKERETRKAIATYS